MKRKISRLSVLAKHSMRPTNTSDCTKNNVNVACARIKYADGTLGILWGKRHPILIAIVKEFYKLNYFIHCPRNPLVTLVRMSQNVKYKILLLIPAYNYMNSIL